MDTELARRIAFAVVAAPLAIGVIYLGGAPLAALLSMIAAVGAWELFRLARTGGIAPLDWLGIALAALVPLTVHGVRLGVFHPPLALYAVLMLVVLAVAIWARGVAGHPLAATAITLFGVLYLGGMLSFGYGLRYHRFTAGPNQALSGTALVLLPVLLTWASDTGAYFVGRRLGRRKLIPAVSPGKTVEGSVGALVTCVVVCWLFVRFALRPVSELALTPAGIIIFALAVSVAAQVGDLAESLLKREAGVKDSSHLLPGHGGILDRFDSLLFVLPVSFLLLDVLLIYAPR